MEIKGIIDESFVDYKKPSMYIAFPNCNFKCDRLNNCKVCQNSKLALEPSLNISMVHLIERYITNPITQAIVLSGLEPFDSFLEVLAFVSMVREDYNCNDDIVIFTGYTQAEIETGNFGNFPTNETAIDLWNTLKGFSNVYVKFGRYVMNDTAHFDEVLGIKLASSNQYGVKISNE